jgi:hypothetical protein
MYLQIAGTSLAGYGKRLQRAPRTYREMRQVQSLLLHRNVVAICDNIPRGGD